MPAKFTIFKDKANQFRFNLKAVNGEIIAVGESYPDKKSVLKGVASIIKNAPIALIVDNTVEKDAAKKPAAKTAKVAKAKVAKTAKAKVAKAKPAKTKTAKEKTAKTKTTKAKTAKTKTADKS